MIDPDKLPVAAVALGHKVARRIIARFLNALLADDEAMERGGREFVRVLPDEFAFKMRAALIAAMQEEKT